jgi:hypothetical protein
MVWGEHWLQRLSLVLVRGQASLVLGAVASVRNNAEGASGRKASPEFSETRAIDGLSAKRQPPALSRLRSVSLQLFSFHKLKRNSL